MIRAPSALRGHRAWAAVWLLLLLACPAVQAQAPVTAQRESAVKAAFLYRFMGFVEWPSGALRADEPLSVAVLGSEPVAADLEQIATTRSVDGRRIVVRRLREGEASGNPHLLFIGATTPGRLRDALAAASGPVLVVTEQEGALRAGSVLNFQQEDGRVRFSASVASADARGLRLSARLLAVASQVEGRGR